MKILWLLFKNNNNNSPIVTLCSKELNLEIQKVDPIVKRKPLDGISEIFYKLGKDKMRV